MTAVPTLSFAHASVTRGNTTLLNSIDWQVSGDERWIVLGPNGAGKTTLFSLAAGQMHPSSGSVMVLGERLGQVDVFELRTRIGLSSASLAERIPADELVRNVVVTAAYAVIGRWREEYESLDHNRAEMLLDMFGAASLADRRYGTLSEGERKRVQIARSLMTDPELMLLDEPAAGLDLGGREALVRQLGELASDEHAPAMVLITHHVEEIPPNFTHLLLLRSGAVVAAGPIADTLTANNLSLAFGMPLELERRGSRFTARSVAMSHRPRHGS